MLKEHWEDIYENRDDHEVSWFQQHPSFSLDLIARAELDHDDPIIDVGAGASRLADHLLASGYRNLTLLDLSEQALRRSSARLAERGEDVEFIEADVLSADLPHKFRLWHDRAVFHFLTEPDQRLAYHRRLMKYLDDGGFFIVATFDENGPPRCSGLPVVRYSVEELAEEFSENFDFLSFLRDDHMTPAGRNQSFIFALFQKR